jgi:hypothetical protein
MRQPNMTETDSQTVRDELLQYRIVEETDWNAATTAASHPSTTDQILDVLQQNTATWSAKEQSRNKIRISKI